MRKRANAQAREAFWGATSHAWAGSRCAVEIGEDAAVTMTQAPVTVAADYIDSRIPRFVFRQVVARSKSRMTEVPAKEGEHSCEPFSHDRPRLRAIR
jgi:hypothetical protein